MKYKFFSAGSPADIEKVVNEWVGKQQPPVTIHLSDTKFSKIKSGKNSVGVVTVGIWYD